MIPLRLEIGNFLSYQDATTLDFHGIHLACISGPNGAGKSSILDAITWVLFGRSRSRSDDDVVNRQAFRAGQAAQIDFTFELEGAIYRVIRSKKSGKPATLEFQMAVPDSKWKSLSEAGVRSTQAAIEALLRMNFDVFINASFLLQGKADEFTTKTANKRKEILADLLGVNEWDRYKEAAAERRKDVQNRLLLLDGRLQEIDEELAEQPAREAALAAAGEALALINEQLKLHEQILQERRRIETAIEQQKQTTSTLAKNRANVERSLAGLEKTLTKRREERRLLQETVDQAQTIEKEYQVWQDTQESVRQWQQKADAYASIQQERRPYELRVESERSRLEQRRVELEKQSKNVLAMTGSRTTLIESLAQKQEQLQRLSAELASLSEKESAWHDAQKDLQQIQSTRDLMTQEQSQLAAQAATVETRRAEKASLLKNQAVAREALLAVDDEMAQIAAFSQQLSEVNSRKTTLQADQPRLMEEMNKLDDRIKRLDSESGGLCPVCGQDLSDDHRHGVLQEARAEGKECGDKWRHNREQIETLTLEATELEAKIADGPQQEREKSAQQKSLAMASARLEEIDRIIESWSKESQSKLDALNQALADDSQLKAQQASVTGLAAEVTSASKVRSEKENLQAEITKISARVSQIDDTVKQWEAGDDGDGSGSRAELARVTGRIESNEILTGDQQVLAELSEEAVRIGYDPGEHQAVKKKVAALTDSDQRHQQLLQARAAVKPLDDSLADLDRQFGEQQTSLQESIRQYDESVAALESLSAGVVDLVEVENKVQNLREQQIEAHRREETAQQGMNVLGDLRIQRDELADRRNEHTQLIRRLQLLEKACGREGVQALLIERALPEIEDDANELLDRLSAGQMQIIFDTQRKLKTSDRLAETLDIRIVDGAGERPYENYSGGEQFRVNFAIRLALSKILTRRAGARLQTLVIDEGFGSQDPEGRQRLIEAINTVQDDFERVLVITHIDEMREVFPNRIEVEKGPQGSRISVS